MARVRRVLPAKEVVMRRSAAISVCLAIGCLFSSTAPASARPRVSADSLKSEIYGRVRPCWVYTPPKYSSDDTTTYDLLLAFDGSQSLEEIPFPAILDSLNAAGRIPPMVAVLIDNGSGVTRLGDLANQPRFVEFMGKELLPWVRSRWRVTHDPKHTLLAGSSAGGLAAAYLALERPDLFGNVLSQSGAFWRGSEGSNAAPFEWLTEQYAKSPKKDIHFVLDVGALETRGTLSGTAPSILEANRRLNAVLEAKGYLVTYTEVPGGVHSPESWRQRLPIDLVTLAGSKSPH
jgi:enterochelin esterase-like enzyme